METFWSSPEMNIPSSFSSQYIIHVPTDRPSTNFNSLLTMLLSVCLRVCYLSTFVLNEKTEPSLAAKILNAIKLWTMCNSASPHKQMPFQWTHLTHIQVIPSSLTVQQKVSIDLKEKSTAPRETRSTVSNDNKHSGREKLLVLMLKPPKGQCFLFALLQCLEAAGAEAL